MDGFINLLKPAGMTSHDAVSALRRILCTKKIGHTGTLDPMATGVLSMCVGQATRAAEYIECDKKSYRCELRLGLVTDTGDIWGAVIDDSGLSKAESITEEEIINVISSMQGQQDQYPPAYSAIRVNGKHLYEYARKGQEVEIKPRQVTLHEIRPVSVFHEPGRVIFDVSCSKGTYIRSVCTDIGEKLGCGATMTFLTRTSSGAFRLEDAVTIEELLSCITEHEGIPAADILNVRRAGPPAPEIERYLIPVDRMLEGFGIIVLDETEENKYVNGGRLSGKNVSVEKENSKAETDEYKDLFRVYGSGRRFLGTAVYDRKSNNFKAGKVFFRW